MIEKIRTYVDSAFFDAPNTKAALELKQEIYQNTIDRFNDLVAEGKSEEAAYELAIAGIGDVTELITSLKVSAASSGYTQQQIDRNRSRSAAILSVAVMLYILSILPVIVLQNEIGICIMFVVVAAATGLIIFNANTRIKYVKNDDTVVQNFKEWQHNSNDRQGVRKSVEGAMWSICLALYFIVSFSTGAWYITWVIFIIAAAVDNIIRACFDLKG